MAHLYRFFAKKLNADCWQLEDDEVTHATKVLRLESGMPVEVMDGEGLVAVGKFLVESKSKVFATDCMETFTERDPIERVIILGALKPGDIDDIIAPLVELGIDRIVVFHQAETAHFRLSDSAEKRWSKLAKAAMKQSKRPWNVAIHACESLTVALSSVSSFSHKWLMSPSGSLDVVDGSLQGDIKVGIAALIGGEKGLTTQEEQLARDCGFVSIRVGPWVMRAKTAAPAVATFLGMMPRLK